MKMRKILPLVILAVGALFLLSGCDAMLDAIFQNNQMTVEVSVWNGTYPVDWSQTYYYGRTSGIVTVYLTNTSTGSTTTANIGWTSADGAYVYYQADFTDLKNDTYLVTAWYTSYYTGGGPWSRSQTITPHDAAGHSSTVTMTF